MDSFYGGKQGISFVIKKRFKSIAEMDEQFSDPTYNQVWYGEYCIIDTVNRNDKDNGKIFKRTGKHTAQDDTLKNSTFAEYVGQVLGPAGGIPNVELENFETLKDKFQSLNGGQVYYWGTGPEHPIPGYIQEDIQDGTDRTTSVLVPKELETEVDYISGSWYHDHGETPVLKYKFYTFQDNKKNEEGDFPISTVGIAFQIPYVDFTMDIEGVNPEDGFTLEKIPLNDFYYKYNMKVPANIPGPSLRNTQIITRTSENPNVDIYNIEDTKFNEGKLILPFNSSNPSDSTNVQYITKPFGQSERIEVAQLFYYDYSTNSNDEVIGYTPVIDPRTGEAARFFVRNIFDIKSVTLSNNRNSNDYGQLTVKSTGVDIYENNIDFYKDTIPLIKNMTVDMIDQNGAVDNNYYLNITYAGQNTPEKFKIAPSQWGVWAQELTREGTNGSILPEGPKPQDNQDITDIDRSAGDLGILRTEINGENGYELYFWKLTDNGSGAHPRWTGEWLKIQEGINKINLAVEGFADFDNSNYPPLTFTTTSITTSTSQTPSGETPWE